MLGLTMSAPLSGYHLTPFLDVLRCPVSGARLILDGTSLVTDDGCQRYEINQLGIPLFAQVAHNTDTQSQRCHYDKIAAAYVANLAYPHTREYLNYLDRVVLESLGPGEIDTLAELCCGNGEGLALLGRQTRRYVGIDISENMLTSAISSRSHAGAVFLQGDATRVPLADASIDVVVMLGGVHHVTDRAALFSEIARILKPGGRFIYREPVSDFLLWRALRAVIYRVSPMLDHATERPLLFNETLPMLEQVGLVSSLYRTCGFLGFCLFMNADVLFVNRLFRFIPGICYITRASIRLDEAILKLPGFARAGLQVIGVAVKPNMNSVV